MLGLNYQRGAIDQILRSEKDLWLTESAFVRRYVIEGLAGEVVGRYCGCNSAGRSGDYHLQGPYLGSGFHPDSWGRPSVSQLAAAHVQRTWTCRRGGVLVKIQTYFYSPQDENLRDPSFAARTVINESISGPHSSKTNPTESKRGAISSG